MDFRALFNTHKWHTDSLGALTLSIRHRGAPGDTRRVFGSDILEITGGGLFVRALDNEGKPVDDGRAFIPYHRILRIVRRDPVGTNPGGAPEELLFEKPAELLEKE